MPELEKLKATQIPNSVLLRYLRLVPEYVDEVEQATVNLMYDAAISYICETYGITREYADECPDIAIAVLILVRDMYDNRTLYVEKSNVNRTVSSILASHDHNLL